MDKAITFTRKAAGWYESTDGRWIIDNGEMQGEWSVRLDGDWHEYFKTLREAKAYIQEAL